MSNAEETNKKTLSLLKEALKSQQISLKVSSVLNNETKLWGKQNLLDGSEETCWNSDQLSSGSKKSPYLVLDFSNFEIKKVGLNSVKLKLKFQGGFTSSEVEFFFYSEKEWKKFNTFFLFDNNDDQIFTVIKKNEEENLFESFFESKKFKLVFKDPKDFFGRITLYTVDFLADYDV
ncbi:Nuclear receptor 2C2-associated protein [Clydaea vesicula]|uniref:Nuclear receptor 2C2-associated protein n=1 Tax=Clydaea vesicula TaxID=447962 RepID=A0AAD5XTC3_9FUNG|nr:Nuclear receptor 2C2-associated protein [Clydaea vesicula]